MISDSLRSSRPLETDILIASWDTLKNEPNLYWLDRVGSIKRVLYSTHGKYTPFLLSIIDRKHSQKSLTESSKEEGLSVLRNCWDELTKRAALKVDKCEVLCVNESGISKVNLHDIEP